MTPEKLDLIFPFLVFCYGATVSFVLHTPFFAELAERRLPPDVCRQLQSHRVFGLLCLVVGAGWSLQNLWL